MTLEKMLKNNNGFPGISQGKDGERGHPKKIKSILRGKEV